MLIWNSYFQRSLAVAWIVCVKSTGAKQTWASATKVADLINLAGVSGIGVNWKVCIKLNENSYVYVILKLCRVLIYI